MKPITIDELETILKDLEGEIHLEGTLNVLSSMNTSDAAESHAYSGCSYSGSMIISRYRSSGKEYHITPMTDKARFNAYFSSENKLEMKHGKDRHDMGWLDITLSKESRIRLEYIQGIKY